MADLKLATDQAVNQVKSQVEELVDSLRLDDLTDQVAKFGKEKPVALALAALTVGFAAGLLMRRSA